jgi:hypothetical protein
LNEFSVFSTLRARSCVALEQFLSISDNLLLKLAAEPYGPFFFFGGPL